MDYLWSPWRYRYVTQGSGSGGCIFCEFPAKPADRDNLILHRGRFNFVLLNRYPYTSGHLMVAPYAHVDGLAGLNAETLAEMMSLAQVAERALRAEYKPDGLNAGFNIGRCAGAGIEHHVHLHILPRWFGDTNFMTAIAETRVLPEDLDASYAKLLPHFTLPSP